MLKINKKKIKPYGDRLDDGAIQLSFTFPVDLSPEAREAARQYVERLGLKDVVICSTEAIGRGFTHFVAYGHARHTIDVTHIKVPRVDIPEMDFMELRSYMERNLKVPIVVVGATTGSDAHTVGIDAIMNMKGIEHDYGLERYPLFKAYNLRSQLTNRQLIDRAVELKADAVLVSQVVTQRDSHIGNLKELHDLWRGDKRISKNTLFIIGGPRIDHSLARKLGFDAGFGSGTKPSQVGGFIVHEYMKRHHIKEKEAPVVAEAGMEGPMTTIFVQAAHPRVVHPRTEHPRAAHPRAAHPRTAHPRAAHPSAENKTAHEKGAHPKQEAGGQAPRKKSRRGRRGGRRRGRKKTAAQKE